MALGQESITNFLVRQRQVPLPGRVARIRTGQTFGDGEGIKVFVECARQRSLSHQYAFALFSSFGLPAVIGGLPIGRWVHARGYFACRGLAVERLGDPCPLIFRAEAARLLRFDAHGQAGGSRRCNGDYFKGAIFRLRRAVELGTRTDAQQMGRGKRGEREKTTPKHGCPAPTRSAMALTSQQPPSLAYRRTQSLPMSHDAQATTYFSACG